MAVLVDADICRTIQNDILKEYMVPPPRMNITNICVFAPPPTLVRVATNLLAMCVHRDEKDIS